MSEESRKFVVEINDILRRVKPDAKSAHELGSIVASLRGNQQLIELHGWTPAREESIERAVHSLRIFVQKGRRR